MDQKREYAFGTSLISRQPWGIFISGRAMCADGKIRALSRIAATADTFFSVSASVRVRGKTVAGYITFTTKSGSSFESADDPAYVEFRAVQNGKNYSLLAQK